MLMIAASTIVQKDDDAKEVALLLMPASIVGQV